MLLTTSTNLKNLRVENVIGFSNDISTISNNNAVTSDFFWCLKPYGKIKCGQCYP